MHHELGCSCATEFVCRLMHATKASCSDLQAPMRVAAVATSPLPVTASAWFPRLQPQCPAMPPSDRVLPAPQPNANTGPRRSGERVCKLYTPRNPRANQGPTQKEETQRETPGLPTPQTSPTTATPESSSKGRPSEMAARLMPNLRDRTSEAKTQYPE